ncbi:hypothetical protein C3R74_11340 [Acidithiobacillus ferridurans]|uniref:hypothetical protein n=1 Tax=Acidithiobacillus ferridurans TaxID=1232575 RepID=UPI000DE20E2C|nr:hypothetical protein [Acidithiobacillus ferridurans]RBL99107.1 hypothetical protein C3R74_11340 [Acidithiobacillus ferridurans]
MVNKEPNMDAEAADLLTLPANEFAASILTILYLNVLMPKGVKEMTVIFNGSVITLGQYDPMDRLRRAIQCLADEIRVQELKSA